MFREHERELLRRSRSLLSDSFPLALVRDSEGTIRREDHVARLTSALACPGSLAEETKWSSSVAEGVAARKKVRRRSRARVAARAKTVKSCRFPSLRSANVWRTSGHWRFAHVRRAAESNRAGSEMNRARSPLTGTP